MRMIIIIKSFLFIRVVNMNEVNKLILVMNEVNKN